MGNLLAYSGIVTKIRAMESRLLKTEQFKKIANMHSVQEVILYLRDYSSYRDVLKSVDIPELHRGDIEKLLTRSLYTDYVKLYRFCSLRQRNFLKLYIKKYEVDLINYCFRIVLNQYKKPFDLYYNKPFFDRYSQISIDKLITARNAEELTERLKGTEYYEPLCKLSGKDTTLFDYNLTLDLYYFTNVWKKRKKALKKKELEIFTNECGVKIDLLNLQWIYRAKRYYDMSPADIYTLLIPLHYKISTAAIKKLAESKSPEEFSAIMDKTFYSRRYTFSGNLTIEKMYYECLHNLYALDSRRNPYSIAAVNTYLFLKEEELKKLTTAIECIRYGLTPGETLAYVGGNTQ